MEISWHPSALTFDAEGDASHVTAAKVSFVSGSIVVAQVLRHAADAEAKREKERKTRAVKFSWNVDNAFAVLDVVGEVMH